jgi:hypothetical protein
MGRSGGIRTPDNEHPKLVRYQAALHSEYGQFVARFFSNQKGYIRTRHARPQHFRSHAYARSYALPW